jgi:cysteine desulfurase
MLNVKKSIYLDHAATTPVDSRVLAAMMPYFTEAYGNSSSIHRYGQQAEAALESARETLAHWLNCQPDEIIFTSCGSESDNLALRGIVLAARQRNRANHMLISPVEHHAVSKTAQQLASISGFELEYLPIDSTGIVDPADVSLRIRPDTALVSVIYANNEIGTINPISEIGAVCRAKGVPFHTDAVQAAGYQTIDTETLNVDLLALGAHKFYGPKGVGALYVRKGTPLLPILTGGGQERGRRAGTHNIPYIVGMAAALDLAQSERAERSARLLPLRDYLIGHVLEEIPHTKLTGHPIQRLPNHASFTFQSVDGNALLALLDVEGFACSSGSACKTGDPEPSEVLTALGLSPEWALGSLRVTLGNHSTSQEIQEFFHHLPAAIQRIRSLAR